MKVVIQPNGANNEYYIGVVKEGPHPVALLFPKTEFVMRAGEVEVPDETIERAALAADFSYELMHAIPSPEDVMLALYRSGIIDLPSALDSDRARRVVTRCFNEAVDEFFDQLRKGTKYYE